MDEDRMPTLFEILNRFSRPPVDLWSFYIYLKEHYGGVEYLEFWLDCASHRALCKDLARGVLKSRQLNDAGVNNGIANGPNEKRNSNRVSFHGLEPGFGYEEARKHEPMSPALTSRARRVPSAEERSNLSLSSSVLFDILKDDPLESGNDHQRRQLRLSQISANEERDIFDIDGNIPSGKRFSTLSYERARNKRDTVSRLSEILDNMHMPEYPSATATSPTRHRKVSQELDYNLPGKEGYFDGPAIMEKRPHQDLTNQYSSSERKPPTTPPPHVTLVSPLNPQPANAHNPYLENPRREADDANKRQAMVIDASNRAIRDSALRIINTYLTPKAPKEIDLPSNQGWSMADEICQLSIIPGGLDNPKVFVNATTYVFEALEREALPGFLIHRALSNVQPVSAIMRLVGGLIALFGAFWLSFVYILLNWDPKSHRCWVILPFSFGWYLTLTGLYHVDPLLAFSKLSERDGGGLASVQERFVWKILMKRGLFVMTSVVLITAAFCVLFILVPGHRL